KPAVDSMGNAVAGSTWTVAPLPSMANAQHSLSASLLPDQTVLVADGFSDLAGTTRVRAAELFNPLDDISTPAVEAPRFVAVASAAAIDNGRVFIAGGDSATGTTATMETFTPANGANLAPAARTILPSSQQSWAYGAPIYYRVTDPEVDRTRVEVQFIDRSPA